MIPKCREFKSPHPHHNEYTPFEEWLKVKHHSRDSTIISKVKILKALSNQLNLWDSKAVADYIARCSFKDSYKNNMLFAYSSWTEFQGFKFEYEKYKVTKELPYIPLEKEIDQLIGVFSNSRYGALLLLLKETAFRPSEGICLQVKDVDLERGIITLNNPLKGSNARQSKISDRLVSTLMPLVKGKSPADRTWKMKYKSVERTFVRLRDKASDRLANPNLRRITMKTFRHWKATFEYHKTKDILYVQSLLGHKSLMNTQIYTHLVQWDNDESWTCRATNDLQESIKLIEDGFSYVCDMGEYKLFRKMK